MCASVTQLSSSREKPGCGASSRSAAASAGAASPDAAAAPLTPLLVPLALRGEPANTCSIPELWSSCEATTELTRAATSGGRMRTMSSSTVARCSISPKSESGHRPAVDRCTASRIRMKSSGGVQVVSLVCWGLEQRRRRQQTTGMAHGTWYRANSGHLLGVERRRDGRRGVNTDGTRRVHLKNEVR